MIYTLIIITLCIYVIFIIFRYYRKQKLEWFLSRKVGDKIIVKIYSSECECEREATVIKEPVDKFILVNMDESTTHVCEECSKIRGVNCWYYIDKYYIDNVKKIKHSYEK